jgi:histone acetyltransferase (RNA polymerase elongator complex component)
VSARSIAVLKKHGVRVIELGIPTVNDAILRLLGRGHTAGDFFDAFRILTGEGFEMGMQVMVGLPGETLADLQETVFAMIALAPRFIRIYPLVVIEDTRLFERFTRGDYSPDSLDTAVTKACFVYVSAWSHAIRTIKMGLTENEVIKEKIASGPYHPAFGYLAAFPLGAWIVGHSAKRSRTHRVTAYALAVLMILTVGAAVLYANMRWVAGKPVSILWIITSGFLLFLPGEAIKAGAAMWFSERIRGAVRHD